MSERDRTSDIEHGVPPIAVSSTSTRANHTGSWKYIRPAYQDRVAPCNQGCPVGIDIEGALNFVRQDRIDAAVDLWLRENPLPAVTGRVCYHPCEKACNRASFDEPVSIHGIERMLGDIANALPLPEPAPRTRAETIGIVGSGPAGLACAYHLARLGYGVTIYEADAEPGGILRYGIPEYRLPKRVLAREIERIQALGVVIRCRARVGSELTFGELDRHHAVFVAAGAHKSRPLGVPGEQRPGVRAGLEFLSEVNHGGRPALGKRVVVVGGGNTAMDCARTAVRLGSEVVVVYRRGRAEMPANPEEVEEAVCEGVRLDFLATPVAFLARTSPPPVWPIDGVEASFDELHDEPSNAVGAVRCVRMTLGEPDASGRRRPVPVPGSEFDIAADTVLTALGEDVDLDFAPELLDRAAGVVRVNPMGGTGKTVVFAGGDVTDAPHTVAYALGSGKRAAIGIDHVLRLWAGEGSDHVDVAALRWGANGNVSATRWAGDDPVRRESPVNEVVTPDRINTAHFEHARRHRDRFHPAEVTRRGFDEANLGLRHGDALAEATRCLNCGVCNGCEVCLVFCPDVAIARRADGGFDIDFDYCKGCGICATECPRGAITMTREGL